jgi:hypothetical protein
MFFFFLFVFHISSAKLASLVIIIAFNQLSLTFFVFSIFIIVVVLQEYFGYDQWTGLIIISLSTLPLLYYLVQFGFE